MISCASSPPTTSSACSPIRALVEALREAFRADISPRRRHHHLDPAAVGQRGDGPADAGLDRRPAKARSSAARSSTVFPDNAKRSKPSVYGSYMLMSGETGEPLAVMDGTALTAWRTACASALAARYLAREDASHLVMVGAGALAPHLVRAHASVRPIRRVTLWNRTRRRAVPTAFGLSVGGHRGRDRRRSRGCGARGRHRLLRDALDRADHARRLAEEGRACRSGRRLHAEDARGRRRRDPHARASMSTPAPARRKEAATSCMPLKTESSLKKDIRGDLFELCRGKAKGRTAHRRDHAVQVGRRRDRGSGGRDAGVERARIQDLQPVGLTRRRSRARTPPQS